MNQIVPFFRDTSSELSHFAFKTGLIPIWHGTGTMNYGGRPVSGEPAPDIQFLNEQATRISPPQLIAAWVA
jgi:hypothetical protein